MPYKNGWTVSSGLVELTAGGDPHQIMHPSDAHRKHIITKSSISFDNPNARGRMVLRIGEVIYWQDYFTGEWGEDFREGEIRCNFDEPMTLEVFVLVGGTVQTTINMAGVNP